MNRKISILLRYKYPQIYFDRRVTERIIKCNSIYAGRVYLKWKKGNEERSSISIATLKP